MSHEEEILWNFHLLEKLKIDEKLRLEAEQVAKDAAACLGLALKDAEIPDAFSPVPVTLLPSLTSYQALKDVVDLQKDINVLMHKVSYDREFLTAALSGVSSVDDFIRHLLDIYNKIDIDSQYELEFIRSDYLLHCDDTDLSFVEAVKKGVYKQVEVNMICIAFAGLSSKMNDVHERVLRFIGGTHIPKEPSGDVLQLYGATMAKAKEIYAKEHPPTKGRPQILLTVIHKNERNVIDQRMVEFQSGLICLRRTFQQIAEKGKMEDGRLILEDKEVAVVYYRTGYAPPHYESQKDWATRLMIEQSFALKCPSVAHQLSGFKKIQQELSRPEVLERFVSSKSVQEAMLKTCVGQWDVSSPHSQEMIQKAMAHPELFVLKPNREGGGNNFYDAEVVSKLKEVVNTEQAKEFILMERILPPLQENFLVRPTGLLLVPTVSEIGVFGAIITKGQEILHNEYAKDVLVRTKAFDVGEGGVATGYACLSSAMLL